MDELEMTSGVIPLRHSSLPGHVKLPRRYEKAATGSNGIPARVRKISIQPGQSSLGDSLSDRLDDLMAAFMWVKQELIMLRQHDILLKRQFFNIQDLIQSLRKPSPSSTTTTTTATTASSSDTCPDSRDDRGIVAEKAEESRLAEGAGSGRVSHPLMGEFSMTTFFVRQALSVSVLHDDSEQEEEEEEENGEEEEDEEEGGGGYGKKKKKRRREDLFDDVFFFRHRTSSMRTSRDLAAMARRRGSKELI